MTTEERDTLEKRIQKMKRLLVEEQSREGPSLLVVGRLQGQVSSLAWMLSEFPDERHIAGCICADCSGAELTARND